MGIVSVLSIMLNFVQECNAIRENGSTHGCILTPYSVGSKRGDELFTFRDLLLSDDDREAINPLAARAPDAADVVAVRRDKSVSETRVEVSRPSLAVEGSSQSGARIFTYESPPCLLP